MSDILAFNWGSTNLRALLINTDGELVDSWSGPKGITQQPRAESEATATELWERFGTPLRVFAAGMIGSPQGYAEAPYVACPTTAEILAGNMLGVQMGRAPVKIVPGLKVIRDDDSADVMRGEEIEILGALSMMGDKRGTQTMVLPGTHTKWVALEDGKVVDFSTSMGSEIFDRLSEKGLLSSILQGHGAVDDAFLMGVERARTATLGLSQLLFEVRARTMTGLMDREAATSFARGILIGDEIQNALTRFGVESSHVTMVGSAATMSLYHAAFAAFGYAADIVDAVDANVRGFHALARAEGSL